MWKEVAYYKVVPTKTISSRANVVEPAANGGQCGDVLEITVAG